MTTSGNVFSQALQEITNTKLEELAKKRGTFEKQKALSIEDAGKERDLLDALVKLADGFKQCFGVEGLDARVVRLERFIDQARFDPSVSSKNIERWRSTLLEHLDAQSLKYRYADLYGKLTVEWLQRSTPRANPNSMDEINGLEASEKISAKAKLQARQNWERDVFMEKKVDRPAIENFLAQLFISKGAQAALEQVRSSVSEIESDLAVPRRFKPSSLLWTMKSLLASDRLTNEKRQVLRDFQANELILTEISDVLNMRLSAKDSWSWGSSVSVEARRQINGKFNIHMHEDLLQSIFLQYIGLQWSTNIKQAFTVFQRNHAAWTYGLRKLTPLEKQRRKWFVPSSSFGRTVEQIRNWTYRYGFFLSQLKDSVREDSEVEDGAEEADFAGHVDLQPVNSSEARFTAMPARKEIQEDSNEDVGFGLFDGSIPDGELHNYKTKNIMDAKQRLLHLLSTEILTRSKLYGGITCFKSSFDSLKPLLPHGTIRAVLSFFGVSEYWLSFFDKFLEAPLKFLNEDELPRLRKRGTPSSHPISDFFSETILFCLDLQINHNTDGDLLWRTDDDFWFWSSSHNTCLEAWETIEQFCQIMGLGLDDLKSGSAIISHKDNPIKSHTKLPRGDIRWGMLVLDEKTGRFVIDQKMVDKHVEELRRQLKDKESSLFAWVQAYSTYASVFFTTNFGKPAHCFGRQHLDAMLSMHEHVQKTLFTGANEQGIDSVSDWLKLQIEQRFGVKDVPDGYLFFPTSLGGLGVKSPFIQPLQLRETVTADPNTYFEEFLEAERQQYESIRKIYLDKKAWEYPNRDNSYRPDDPTEFMPFEEYVRFREQLNYKYSHQLVDTYAHLLQGPLERPVENDHDPLVDEALGRIRDSQLPSIKTWDRMQSYWKWLMMLYGPEILEKFGQFQIVDTGLLPMGMVSMITSGKVGWQ